MTSHDLTPLARKLELGDDTVFTVRHAPGDFAGTLGDVGNAIWQQSLLAPLDVVITFHRLHAALVAELPRVTEPLGPEGRLWVAWPRAGSELDERLVVKALERAGFTTDKACHVDDDWTALRFVRRPVKLRPKEAARRKR
ncbi:MAG: hypothetical protein RI958_2402 [Actinomycetota bacterium]|jgi:hypothetical protein